MGKGGVSPDACPICLERVEMEAYLDQCFHRFCFPCMLQWSETRIGHPPACPICKAPYTSVIHNVQRGGHFDRLPVSEFSVGVKPWDLPPSSSQRRGGQQQRVVFVPSEAHKQRRLAYTGGAAPSAGAPAPEAAVPGLSYGANDTRAARVHDWLTIELQALMLDYDVELVVAHVEACIRAAPTGEGSQGWSDAVMAAVQPFVGLHAPQFVKEFTAFFSAGGGRRLAQHAAESSPPFESPARGEAEDTHVGGWDDM